jgi:putative glycosyltransferase (TIGR04372 family)
VIFKKIRRALVIILKSPLYVLAITVVLALRIIRPWVLVRIGSLISSRIGHFGVNTELYLCEYDAGIDQPSQRHIDLFYFKHLPICNQQLAKMWQRTIHIWPAWILAPVARANFLVPGGEVHEAGNTTNSDRDVHNLLDKSGPHLEFTVEEESKGQANLQLMGIPPGSPFVCLTARDSSYLEHHTPGSDSSYHNHRDVDIQNYVLAAEELASRGYFVLRMGAQVREPLSSHHHMVIDYASNGMRSDFMDIYLGAKCTFCVSCGTGFDALPQIFRRPVAFVNHVPIGLLITFQKNTIAITKHHISTVNDRELTLKEIVTEGLGSCLKTTEYDSKDILLVENTSEEIRDLVIEMDERLNDLWKTNEEDELLQQKFWSKFLTDELDSRERRLHGVIKSRFGASFLRQNQWWLE